MSWRIPPCVVLVGALWCSIANAQEVPPRPLGTSQRIAPQPASRAAGPNSAPRAESPREPITPRRETGSADRNPRPVKEPFSLWRVLGSLILVVAGIFGVARLFRSLGVGPFRETRPIPESVCRILGVTSLPNRHTLYLMRIGERVLLMGSTGENLTVLSEITETEEVASITGLCSGQVASASEDGSFFRRLLNHGSQRSPEVDHDSLARQQLEAKLSALAKS